MPLLTALLALVASGVTAAAGRALWDLVEHRAPRWKVDPKWVVYLWPIVLFGIGLLVAFVWSPSRAHFPAPDFYYLAAEVMPVLLIALVVERSLITALPRGVRVELAIVLILGETAAFVAVSRSFADSDFPELVGGSVGFTGILATLTITGLVSAILLVVLAVMLEARAGPDQAAREGEALTREEPAPAVASGGGPAAPRLPSN
jgi:hypothetical protein